MATRFATLSRTELAAEFGATAADAAAGFRALDARQLNWKPDATAWSVAECFDHLVKSGEQMQESIGRALDRTAPRTLWQRLPLWPRLLGWMLITSLAPDAKRKLKAPTIAIPATANLPPDIVDRFVALQHDCTAGVLALIDDDERRVLVSPFAPVVTYTVIDGYRIIATHQRRHLGQAARVMAAPGFPAGPS